jgi:antitoxin ParD1/3/4
MKADRTITITLAPDATEALEASVQAGEHISIEAAAAAVIDEWWADRAMGAIGVERLRRMIGDGVDSGPSVDGEAVFARLIAKYDALASAKGE